LTRIVVDANVAIKWLLPEEHSEAAYRLLQRDLELQAPDLLWAESGNILWKKWRKKELTAEAMAQLLPALRRFPLRILPSEPLCDLAGDIARRFDRSFYDSLYLALSLSSSCPLVTADLRLYNALRTVSDFDLVWIGDVKA
jgi:predicted nucleic acid-binding protein